MPILLRITLWLLPALFCAQAAADDLAQRLDALTLDVQVLTPGVYQKLEALGPRVLTATPRQQMRWHVLSCEAAAGSRSLADVKLAVGRGMALAERLKAPQLIAYMNACEAGKLMMLGQYDKALNMVNRAIHWDGADNTRGVSLLRRADIYAEMGDLEASLDDLHQALAWMESIHEEPPLFQPHPAQLSYSLARTYFYLGDYLRSDTLFEQAAREAPQGSTLSWVIQVNQTFTLIQQQRYLDARARMESLTPQAAEMEREDQARFNLLFSHIALKLARYDEAYGYARAAAAIFEALGMEERQARARSFLAEAAFQQQRFDEGRRQLQLAREYYGREQNQQVLTDLDRIESLGEALRGNYRGAYALFQRYHDAHSLQLENQQQEALAQQQVQLDQRLEKNREQLASQSAEYFRLHNQLMFWQITASTSLLLWLVWVLFRLTAGHRVNRSQAPPQAQDWRSRLEQALANTDRTLPVVKLTWEGAGLSRAERKRILNKDLRLNDLMLECGDQQLIILLVDASEAEAERLRYRLSRNLAESGCRNIATGVARSHPLDQVDSLLARLECNQIQHSLMLADNVIRPDKRQWRQ